MAYANHLRVSVIGTLGTLNKEMFQYGLSLQAIGTIGTVDDLFQNGEQIGDIVSDISNFHADSLSRISSQAVIRVIKFAKIGTDGKYIGPPRIWETEVAGGAAHDSRVLPQNALAISLTTSRTGPTGRGRFFIPMPMVDASPTNGFLIGEAVALEIRDRAEQLMEDLNNAPGVEFGSGPQVVIASSKGYNTPVNGVRVGRVVDTIRTRRNKLPEAYTAIEQVG